ncbi:MAG: CHASE2 domain-containing protein [Cyanobacteriota bacterium]
MGKLVVLRLDGETLEQGCRVTLQIEEDGENAAAHTVVEMTGYLPPAPELATYLEHHWQQKYRCLGAPYRLEPIGITYGGSVNQQRISECQESAEELRSRFTAWLDSELFRTIDKHLREELNRDETIRFLIRTDNSHLQKLPWHLWDLIERYPNAEVALSPTESRRIHQPPKPALKTQVKILAILGHSEGIDTDADRKLLENLPHAAVTFLVEPKHHQINDQLWEQDWDIIFFAGHSETQGETGRIYINPTDSLTINELWYALKKAVERGLKLAIFNSCDGLGLARQLNDLHIPQMIVMRELIPDQIAQEFLKYFLSALASGKSLYLATRAARERLHWLEREYPCASWLPVIYQNLAYDPPIFPSALTQQEHWWQGWQKVLVASVAVTSLVMGVRMLGFLQPVELKAFDQVMQWRPAEKPDSRLLIVQVTAEDIAKLGGEYPLQDKTLLRLLKKLEQYQPRAIGLDIYRDRVQGEGHTELVQYLQKSDSIIPVCVVPSAKIPQGVAPPPGISTAQLGFADVVRDPDNIVRRHLIAMKPPAASSCSTYYALSFQLALRYIQAEGQSLEFITADHWRLGQLDLKKLNKKTGFYQTKVGLEGFQVLLNYRSSQSLKDIADSVTLNDVFTNRIHPDSLKNKIILIGMTDPTIQDNFQTPYNQEIRGLILHAQLVSQILSAAKEQRGLLWFLPVWGDGVWVLAWSVAGGILAISLGSSPLRLGLIVIVGLVSLNGICLILLVTKGCILPLIPSSIALVATVGSLIAYRGFQLKKLQ